MHVGVAPEDAALALARAAEYFRLQSKHRVDFVEAATVFGDPLSSTIRDIGYWVGERRKVTMGMSYRSRLLVSFTRIVANGSGSSRQDAPHGANKERMKKEPEDLGVDGMRPEYAFSAGERGKYAEQFAKGSNVAMLDPDVAAAFPTARAVNDALRKLAGLDAPG